MIFVNYPHMPTGQHADLSRLQELLRFCAEHDLLLCNDNPYSHTLSEDPFSIFQLEGSHTHAIELNSLSKSHSMAGARVGMMTGQPNLLDPVFKVQSSFSSGMFYPIQQGAITALKQGEEAFQARNAIYRARRKLIWELMDMIGCTYSRDTGGLFVWARVPNTYLNGQELSDQLLRSAHVFLTPGIVFGTRGESYIRASLCQPEQVIQEAINRIHTYQSTKS
jgi:aspartate/methionine/tyrosine aminotransferase